MHVELVLTYYRLTDLEREREKKRIIATAMETEREAAGLHIPEEWTEAAHTIAYDSVTSPPPVAVICGPKNSGKTTFSRHLVNVLLQRYKRVAYLDTDVGQTEFTPPGCLSLTVLGKVIPALPQKDLTVPCLKTPESCYFFGDISSKRDQKMYLACIDALHNHYRREYCFFDKCNESPSKTGMPLVVNTPGWVKGVGYDILVNMLLSIVPSHVVKIRISADSKNLEPGAFWLEEEDKNVSTLIEINSACQDSFKRSAQKDARLLRDVHIMAYFRQCFPSDMNITAIKELALALAAHPPYELPMSSVKIKHLHCEVPSTEIYYSLNATIVGLGVISEGSDVLPRCVGLGIVRGVDTFKRVLYVITPVPQNVLENVDLLLQGFIQIPTCLLQVQGCISPYMASNVWSADQLAK